jgi:hypothetical protein
MATDKSIDQLADMNIDYAAVFDAEFGRLGSPLPTSVARYGYRGIDRIARQILVEQGATSITQEQYAAAVRKAINKVMDTSEPLSDPYNRAADEAAIQKLHADTLLVLGKVEGEEFDNDAYMSAMLAVVEAQAETITATDEGLTPDWVAQIEGEDAAAFANQE